MEDTELKIRGILTEFRTECTPQAFERTVLKIMALLMEPWQEKEA
jgi:hypothetical protein